MIKWTKWRTGNSANGKDILKRILLHASSYIPFPARQIPGYTALQMNPRANIVYLVKITLSNQKNLKPVKTTQNAVLKLMMLIQCMKERGTAD